MPGIIIPSPTSPVRAGPEDGLEELLSDLSKPEAYPHPAEDLQVIQTHISAVFLAGPYADKVKKPVDLGFVDYTTPERRRRFCEEEVRLNRRLAPRVYLGVVPITAEPEGLRIAGPGHVRDWAVRMQRLPADRTLAALIRSAEIEPETMRLLGRRIAAFHARAETSRKHAVWGSWEAVAENCRENFEQIEPCVGRALSQTVLDRLRRRTDFELDFLRSAIESRAARGMVRDTHGDLHLDHVYFLPEEPDDALFTIVDCIEFNERFRYADPVSDLAFLVMDLEFRGRADLARALADAYFAASQDLEGRSLLPFYAAYRAVVRGKVQYFKSEEKEIADTEIEAAMRDARAHFLFALGRLSPPWERPCLLLLGGLPGSGKSTLAAALADRADFEIVSSDRIRKALAGMDPQTHSAAPFGEGIYSAEWNDRTYAACLERCRTALFQGGRILVDAGFREEARRKAFIELARQWGAPCRFLHCETQSDSARQRLEAANRGASDADWEIYQHCAQNWEPCSPDTEPMRRPVPTDGPVEETARRALNLLMREELA